MSTDIQKRRLLRLSLAHYRQPDCSEEDLHQFVTVEHAAQAAKIHARHGVEGYAIYFSPSSFRQRTQALNATIGSPWVISDHDVQVEFLFRDFETLTKFTSDPDFQKLQAEEGPYVSKIHVVTSIGWLETYVKDGEVVNIDKEGKPTFPGWKEVSVAP